MKITAIEITDIKVGERIRGLDDKWVQALAVLIDEESKKPHNPDGMKVPIEVFQLDDGYQLVAGYHRLEACKSLGRKTIKAIVLKVGSQTEAADLLLAEISENLFRQELDALSRAGHLAELKAAYEMKFPWLRNGGDGKYKERLRAENKDDFEMAKIATSNNDHVLPDFEGQDDVGRLATWSANRFTAEAASKLGLSERSIRLAVKLWTGIAPNVRDLLSGTEHANKQSDLLRLSEMSHEDQGKVCDLLFSDPPEASSLGEAINQVLDIVKPFDQKIDRLSANFLRLNKRERDSFFHVHQNCIREWAKEQGWLS